MTKGLHASDYIVFIFYFLIIAIYGFGVYPYQKYLLKGVDD